MFILTQNPGRFKPWIFLLEVRMLKAALFEGISRKILAVPSLLGF